MTGALITSSLVMPSVRPRRRFMALLLNRYEVIVALFVTALLASSTISYKPVLTAALVLVYWCYVGSKLCVSSNEALYDLYTSNRLQLARAIFLTLVTSGWLGYLYLGTDYLQHTGGRDTLWLLLVLSTFVTSQKGATGPMLLTLVLGSVSLVAISVMIPQTSLGHESRLSFALGVTNKVIWLVFLSLILHTLARYLSDLYANVNLLDEAQEKMHLLEMQVADSSQSEPENALIRLTVDCLAAAFGYDRVSIYCITRGGDPVRVADSLCGTDASLQGHPTAGEQAVVSQVAATGLPYVSSDRATPTDSNPGVGSREPKSRLAVPIILTNRIGGVLLVQAFRKGNILPVDQMVTEVVASQLGRAIDSIRMLRWQDQVNHIVESISQRLLSQYDKAGTLEQITEAACEEFGADVVVLYEHDPSTGEVGLPIWAGTPFQPEIFSRDPPESDSLVYRLIRAGDDHYFHTHVGDLADDLFFARSDFHSRTDTPIFVIREQIKSRAVVRLRTRRQCVGLMFLNYRSRQEFDTRLRRAAVAFANLAALAIQQARFHERELQVEREAVALHLHDQLMAQVFGISNLVDGLLADQTLPDHAVCDLAFVRAAVQDLRRDIKYSHIILRDKSLEGLFEEIDKATGRARAAYGVEFSLMLSGNDRLFTPTATRHMLAIVYEAIINAVKHGKAKDMEIRVEISSQSAVMAIADSGRGFDVKQIGHSGGLSNMRDRVKQMGGRISIDSDGSGGTRIVVEVPLPSMRCAIGGN